jgi:hypothetical protein
VPASGPSISLPIRFACLAKLSLDNHARLTGPVDRALAADLLACLVKLVLRAAGSLTNNQTLNLAVMPYRFRTLSKPSYPSAP